MSAVVFDNLMRYEQKQVFCRKGKRDSTLPVARHVGQSASVGAFVAIAKGLCARNVAPAARANGTLQRLGGERGEVGPSSRNALGCRPLSEGTGPIDGRDAIAPQSPPDGAV